MDVREELEARGPAWAAQFESYEPKPEDFDAELPPLMAVKLAAWRVAQAEAELAQAVRTAHAKRVSWRTLGEAVGVSGEVVRQRYAHV